MAFFFCMKGKNVKLTALHMYDKFFKNWKVKANFQTSNFQKFRNKCPQNGNDNDAIKLPDKELITMGKNGC